MFIIPQLKTFQMFVHNIKITDFFININNLCSYKEVFGEELIKLQYQYGMIFPIGFKKIALKGPL